MGKVIHDIVAAALVAILHGAMNTVLMLLFTNVPFGSAESLSYIVYLIVCSAGSLVWIATLLSIATRSSYASIFAILCCFVSFAARATAIFVFGFVWAACENNTICDGGLDCDGNHPVDYVYSRRIVFVAFNVILWISIAGDLALMWIQTILVRNYRLLENKAYQPVAQ